jgi:hypothetical protein
MEGAILRSRTGRFTGDADRAFAELGRILRGSGHEADSFLQDQVILETEPPSNPKRFTHVSQPLRDGTERPGPGSRSVASARSPCLTNTPQNTSE